MQQGRRRPWTVAGMLLVPVLVAACGGSEEQASDAEQANDAAVIEQVKGTDVTRVILTAEAAQRLGIRTATVRSDGSGTKRTVIPYDAVLYDPDGKPWTYTNPKPLVFQRTDIRVDRIDGDSAILAKGPSVGTAVVTVGSTEIWGVEYGGIEED
jgi:hypothetical protein